VVWLSSVWFDEVDFLKCSRSASQLSFTNLSKMSRVDRIASDQQKLDMVLLCMPSQFGLVKLGWELSGLVWFGVVEFGLVLMGLVWFS